MMFKVLVVSTVATATLVQPQTNFVDGQCVADFDVSTDSGLDLFPEKTTVGEKFQATVAPDYSLLWDVTYHGTYKVIHTSGQKFVLYQCGTPEPTVEGATRSWQVPVTKAATTSTTYIPFLEMIGERDSLVAYGSSMTYVTSPCVKRKHSEGLVSEAYDAMSWSRNDTLLAQLGVELTIADSWSGSAHNAFVMMDTAELGGDNAVLKIAEYVELVGLFFNREAEATAAITRIIENYMCARDAAAAVAETPKKKVLWSTEYMGLWSIPAPATWYAEIIEAAGGDLLVPDTAGLGPLSESWGTFYLNATQIATVAASADVWIVPGAWPATVHDAIADLDVVTSGRVFDYQGTRGGNDWFERRVVEPDTLLLDVAAALNPESDMAADHARVWLRQIAEAVPLLESDYTISCPDTSADYVFSSKEVCEETLVADAASRPAATMFFGALLFVIVGAALY